jgi:hypothetical protein
MYQNKQTTKNRQFQFYKAQNKPPKKTKLRLWFIFGLQIINKIAKSIHIYIPDNQSNELL